MKECELCRSAARMYCESDQASLCWDCDGKVHCANFLVARHLRSLLCHVCQSPTPWKASGERFCPTVSVCESCVENYNKKRERSGDEESLGGNDEDEHEDDAEDDDDGGGDDYDEDYEEWKEEDGDNQVVPLSEISPPPVASCSSSEEDCCRRIHSVGGGGGGGGGGALKRVLENAADLDSDDDIGCSSSRISHNNGTSIAMASRSPGNEEASSLNSSRPLKQPRLCELGDQYHGEAESRSTAIISSLKRLKPHMISDGKGASEIISGICKLSRNQSR